MDSMRLLSRSRARPAGAGDPHDLVRTAGGAGYGRSRPRQARGPAHGRVRSLRGDPRGDHVRCAGGCGGPAMTAPATRATPTVRPGSSSAAKLVSHVATARQTGIVVALVLIIVIATARNPSFVFSGDGFRDLLLTPSLLLLVAVGQAIVIITRNVDLSVGSVVGLTAYLTGRLFVDIPGIPLIAVFFGGLILGALLGLINGALVA